MGRAGLGGAEAMPMVEGVRAGGGGEGRWMGQSHHVKGWG